MRQALAPARLALLLSLAGIGFAPAAATLPQERHVDGSLGFRFLAPKGWEKIALKTDEQWLAAKYLSDKSYAYTDPDVGYTYRHTPEIMVIAFVHESLERKKIVEEEEEDGVVTKKITISNPYKDYEDFLERTYKGGGWFIEEKEEGEHKGLETTEYLVRVEKLARSGPKYIVTWIYHGEEVDFAMQCEVLQDELGKLKRTIDRSLKSFEIIERTEELRDQGMTADAVTFTRKELNEGDPKERRSKRMESQRVKAERTVAALPEGWEHEFHGDVLVVHHDEDKWADRLGEHVEGFLDWLDEELHYFGEGEYARAPIIRVCKDKAEEAAFTRGVVSGTGGGFNYVAPGTEIVTHKDSEGWIGFEVGWVNRMVLLNWMAERNEDLRYALPEWLRYGMEWYVDTARRDGRKMEFRAADRMGMRDAARLAINQDKGTPPREIMMMTREEFRSDDQGQSSGRETYVRAAQAAGFVRFLMSKEANRCKEAKGLLEEYVRVASEVVTEIEKRNREAFKEEGEASTEEEEEERAKARAERWQAMEKELLQTTFERVFGDWSDREWSRLEKAFYDFL